MQFYRSEGYQTKGAPDLFVTSESDHAFVEVKSVTDSLSFEQYHFIEQYNKIVGPGIYVFRVL